MCEKTVQSELDKDRPTFDELWNLLQQYGGNISMGRTRGVVFHIKGFKAYAHVGPIPAGLLKEYDA